MTVSHKMTLPAAVVYLVFTREVIEALLRTTGKPWRVVDLSDLAESDNNVSYSLICPGSEDTQIVFSFNDKDELVGMYAYSDRPAENATYVREFPHA